MNELEFMELLSEIPAEYVEAAAAPQKRRRILRKLYGIPVAAACIAAVIAAALYPRLRTEKLDMVPYPDESSVVSETTDSLGIGGTTSPDSGITVSTTAYTSVNADADRSTTAAGSGHTGQTTAKGGSEPAGSERSGQNGNTTKTTAVHENQGQTTKTTSKQTTGPTNAVTPGATSRTTVAVTPGATTRTPARTTARVTTRLTSRTTAKVTTKPVSRTTAKAVTTAAPRHTTAGAPATTVHTDRSVVTTWATRMTSAPMAFTTNEVPDTSPAPSVATTSPPATSHGSDSEPWGPSHSGSGSTLPGAPGGSENTLPAAQNLKLITEDAYYSSRTSLLVFEPAVSSIPEGFDDCPYWDELDISDYTCLLVRYYGKASDARAVAAELNASGGITLKVDSLFSAQDYCELTVLLFIPHEIAFEKDASYVENANIWSRDAYERADDFDYNSIPLEE